jgi:predicted HTH domain antitoxin
MQTVGIRDLQVNPASFTRPLESNEFVMITKHGKPLGVATSFDNDVLQHGVMESIVLQAFERGDISLGQLAKSLKLTKGETMQYLSMLKIPVTDYDFSEDIKGIERLRG